MSRVGAPGAPTVHAPAAARAPAPPAPVGVAAAQGPYPPIVLFAAIMRPRIMEKFPDATWATACRITVWLWEHVAGADFKHELAVLSAKEAASRAGAGVGAAGGSGDRVAGAKRPRE